MVIRVFHALSSALHLSILLILTLTTWLSCSWRSLGLFREPLRGFLRSSMPLKCPWQAGVCVSLANLLPADEFLCWDGAGRRWGGCQVKYIRECAWHKKDGGWLAAGQMSWMGAAPRVLCAQSCQRSLGRIVEEAVASGSEEEGGSWGTERGDGEVVRERMKGREDEAQPCRLSEGDVGWGLLLQLSQTQMTAPAPCTTHTHTHTHTHRSEVQSPLL